MYPRHLHAQQLILMLIEKGITDIVISPGSRNAPLTLGFSRNTAFNCYSIVDERCAAHVALGMAQQLKRPVAVVCTSGSALLNYYPAIAEAFYSEIPLVVLSADRPPHKIDIADGQTIRQRNVFANHILAQTQLLMIEGLDQLEAINSNNRYLNEVLDAAFQENGPVHINIPFEEPLYDLVELPQLQVNVIPKTIKSIPIKTDVFYNDWKRAARKLVILSTLDNGVITSEALAKLLADPSVLIMSEVSSNVVHDAVVCSIDTLVAPIEGHPEDIERLLPEMVVTVGGMIVSKKIKQLLRKAKGLKHYHLGTNKAYDTFFALKQHLAVEPSSFITTLPEPSSSSDYGRYWQERFDKLSELRTAYFKDMPWSDFKAFELIFKQLPDDLMLQLGNSSTIRYAQLFPMNPTHRVFSNRGTSGIDGSTSTAIGAAMASSQASLFITGDISFFYDSNALWNNYIPKNFKIILINNSGGGIFRILPGHEDRPEYDAFFETKHHLNAAHLCAMYGFSYKKVEEESAFAKAFSAFISQNDRPQLLEIVTPSNVNEKVLMSYFKYLR